MRELQAAYNVAVRTARIERMQANRSWFWRDYHVRQARLALRAARELRLAMLS